MKNKEKILEEIFEDLHIPEIKRALDSDQFDMIVSVHDSIKFYQVLPFYIVKQTENELNWTGYHLAFFTYHKEAVKRAYFSFYLSMMGQKSMSESFQRILLEFIVKGSFWDCVSRKSYRDKKTPHSNRINKVRSVIQERIGKEPGTFSDCQGCSLSAIDAVLDYIDLDETQKESWEKIVPKMNDMLYLLTEWKKTIPIKDPEEIYEIYKYYSYEIHSHPDSILDSLSFDVYTKAYPDFDYNSEQIQCSLDSLIKIVDFGIILTLNTFLLDKHREKNMFKDLPFLNDHIAKFNLPYSKKRIKTLISRNSIS